MSGGAPLPRRGLGRGLGSLIPTQRAEPAVEPDQDLVGRPPAVEPEPGPGPGPRGSVEGGRAVDRGPDDATSGTVSGSDGKATYDASPQVTGPGTPGLRPVEGAYFAELPPDQIIPNRAQPRTVFDEESMAELVHSVREIGLLQPVVVRPVGPESYELVMGERRWRAVQTVGLARIPAIVRETDDVDLLRDALLENLHRADLNPLEEASAYAQLLEDFGCTHAELAERIGRSRPQISNTLRLLRLGPAVQRRVAAGVLSAGHARALAGVEDTDVQDRLASRVVAEGISVRGLEEIVAVGDGSGPARGPARRRPTAPGLEEIADRLGERLDTRVKVDLGRAKGKITVEFASLDDLRRITEIMDPRNRTDRPI